MPAGNYRNARLNELMWKGKVQAARQALSTLTARQAHLEARLNERRLQANRQAEALQTANRNVAAAEKETQAADARLKSLGETLKESQTTHKAGYEALQDQRKHLADIETARKEILDRRSELAAGLAGMKLN